MQEPAKEAYETLLHSRDGQLCDAIFGPGGAERHLPGRDSSQKDRIVKDYAESLVAVTDIKIAVRAQRTKKISGIYEAIHGRV